MKTIKIAGVPEHFNMPWQMCIENGEFEDEGIDLQWTDVPEGTGRLCQMLRDGETDIAVILTEGIVKDIAAGNDSKIVQVYVETPLLWGIHVAAGSSFKTLSDLKNARVAISRYGSGSHLMAIVNAKAQGWDTSKMEFVIVNTMDGAIEALTNGEADYFMWEHFMTKPVVDKGIFRRIDDCPTPWPCFVIAVRNEVLAHDSDAVGTVLDIINRTTEEFQEIPSIHRTIAQRYELDVEDVNDWLDITEWSQNKLDRKTFDEVQGQLAELGIITQKTTYENATG